MSTIIEANPKAVWRQRLRPASFAGARFHVEQQSRSSGMRSVVHEYPKRNDPYTEIMGRHAIRYQITGYCIGPNYHLEKEQLVAVLERPEAGLLVDPYLPTQPMMAVCERYSVSETRERGGYCTFEMSFVQLGKAANAPVPNTAAALLQQAGATGVIGANTLNTAARNFTTGAAGASGLILQISERGFRISAL
jgi:prophage DNA circulation protein